MKLVLVSDGNHLKHSSGERLLVTPAIKQNTINWKWSIWKIKSKYWKMYAKDDPLKKKELIILRAKYNKMSTDESDKSLMWLKQGYHYQGEKPGKLLVWRKKQQTDRAINSIRTPQGILTINPQEINTCFKDFYETLYRSECNQNSDTQETFLDQLQFQSLSDDIKNELDRNITVEELSEAIQNMNSGKAPGPDALPIEFYKTFKTKLAEPPLNMFKEYSRKELFHPL